MPEEYKQETLWRITEDDINDILADNDIPQDEWAEWYEVFRARFTIDDWRDYARDFVTYVKDDIR